VTLLAAALPVAGVTLLAWHGREVAAWIEAASFVQKTLLLLGGGALLAGLSLMPTHAVSLACGYAFGLWLGPAAAWIAISVATILGFVIGQLAAGANFAADLRRQPRWQGVADALLDRSRWRTAWLIGLLRLSPLAPFAATNVALAALRMPWLPYLVGSAFGLAPRVIVVALFGASLAELDWSRPQSPLLLIAGGIATLIALWLIGRVAMGALRSR
jgi:uncharacterized membrane protein YdjX (TVP38/TMEM64 family)